jgi:hypothetical protein
MIVESGINKIRYKPAAPHRLPQIFEGEFPGFPVTVNFIRVTGPGRLWQ